MTANNIKQEDNKMKTIIRIIDRRLTVIGCGLIMIVFGPLAPVSYATAYSGKPVVGTGQWTSQRRQGTGWNVTGRG